MVRQVTSMRAPPSGTKRSFRLGTLTLRDQVSYSGTRWPAPAGLAGRASEGHASLAAFVGGRTNPEITARDDDAIYATVRAELGRALGLSSEPVFHHVRRWPRAVPQYEIGLGRFVERAAEIERKNPRLQIGGNFLRGISVPDCNRNATALAAEISAEIGAERPSKTSCAP